MVVLCNLEIVWWGYVIWRLCGGGYVTWRLYGGVM